MRSVAVIGAGPAGLTAAKHVVEEGMRPTVFERAEGVGGVWRYTPNDVTAAGVTSPAYKCLTTNSSREMTSYSDFPLKSTTALFPSCAEIEGYLADYVKHFNLAQYIRLHSEVVHLKRIEGRDAGCPDRWLITCKDVTSGKLEHLEFDAVMVCCGMFWHPNVPTFPGQETFVGSIVHSHAYRIPDAYAGKNVLLVGIGNSALDISLDVADVARSVVISARTGSIVLSVVEEGQATDQKLLSRATQRMSTSDRLALFHSFQLTTDFMKHGMPAPPMRPEHAHHSLVKKKKEYLARLEEGKIRIKPNIARIEKDRVAFVDGSMMEGCEAIIFCTGYTLRFPFVDDPALVPGLAEGRLDLYKKIFHPLYPSLAFIGQIEAIGSIFAIAEMQSRWATKVFANTLSLPSREVMQEAIEKYKQRLAVMKPKYPMFTAYPTYMDDLAKHLGCLPTPHHHLYQGRARQILEDGPMLPLTYRLHGDGSWSGAPQALARL